MFTVFSLFFFFFDNQKMLYFAKVNGERSGNSCHLDSTKCIMWCSQRDLHIEGMSMSLHVTSGTHVRVTACHIYNELLYV